MWASPLKETHVELLANICTNQMNLGQKPVLQALLFCKFATYRFDSMQVPTHDG